MKQILNLLEVRNDSRDAFDLTRFWKLVCTTVQLIYTFMYIWIFKKGKVRPNVSVRLFPISGKLLCSRIFNCKIRPILVVYQSTLFLWRIQKYIRCFVADPSLTLVLTGIFRFRPFWLVPVWAWHRIRQRIPCSSRPTLQKYWRKNINFDVKKDRFANFVFTQTWIKIQFFLI